MNVANRPQIDKENLDLDTTREAVPDDLVRFVAALFVPDDLILVRVIEAWTEEGKKKSRYVQTEHLTPDQLTSGDAWHPLLRIAERERANLFFGVCPRARANADKAGDIRVVRALWADLDHVRPDEALDRCQKAGLPRPSVVLISGHGVHLYWILAEPCFIDDYPPEQDNGKSNKKSPLSVKGQRIQSIIKSISQVIGGDHTQDLSRILRLPGTLNRKNQRNGQAPVPCVLVECESTRRYPLSLFEQFVTPAVEDSAPETQADPPAAVHLAETNRHHDEALSPEVKCEFDRLVRECENPRDDDRSRADYHLCCWSIRQGIRQEVVWERLKNFGKPGERGQEYFDLTWSKAVNDMRSEPGCKGPEPVRVGDLEIVPGPAHRFPSGKIGLTVTLRKHGQGLDTFELTSSASGRKDAVKLLTPHLDDAHKAEAAAVLGRLLATAAASLGRPGVDGDKTVRQIVAEVVPNYLDLKCRTAKGFYSGKLDREIPEGEFTRHVPPWLFEAVSRAVDAPRSPSGVLKEGQLQRLAKIGLEMLAADLKERLETAKDANLGAESARGKAFWDVMIRVWIGMKLSMRVVLDNHDNGTIKEAVPVSASLVRLVKNHLERGQGQKSGWFPVREGIKAWYRPGPLLAMHYDLLGQMREQLPDVDGQESMNRLGEMYGVFDPSGSVCVFTNHGKTKLSVLSEQFVRRVMDEDATEGRENVECTDEPAFTGNVSQGENG